MTFINCTGSLLITIKLKIIIHFSFGPCIITGIRYYSRVSAIDAAGRASEQVFSDGVVVDVTPPEPQNCIHSGDNLIVNPSFEGQNEPGTR